MNTKQLLAAAALTGLSLGGITLASSASAQTDDVAPADIVLVDEDETTTTEAGTPDVGSDAASSDDSSKGRRGHRGGCDLSEAAEAIGIDEAELKAAVESGESIADVAEANGVDVDTVIDAMVSAKTERLAEKIDEGQITQAEADEKLADAEARITERVNETEAPAES